MTVWQFKGILQRSGWVEPGYLKVDQTGFISGFSKTPPDEQPADEIVDGYLIPGFQNAHSHAFQYAMAGLAEHLPRKAEDDDFWSWREAMYNLALKMRPEDMEAVACMLYAEMARVGYTAVAEFHYLHHDPKGVPYADRAEMGRRLMSAAERAGIHLTLIPIFYANGDFGAPPAPKQRRFISPDVDAYYRLLEASRAALKDHPDFKVGIGCHSLRAVSAEDVIRVFAEAPHDAPLHLHIAEQQKEVYSCLTHLEQRPVAWLLDNVPLDNRFNLVHATHLGPEEIAGLAKSDATVVICPSTEGNLGDGFFPLRKYLEAGGRFSIGTDSHVGLSPMEELRWLDYGQRLKHEKRNVLCLSGGQDSGERSFNESIARGRLAMGDFDQTAYFASGTPFDGVVIDAAAPLFTHRNAERRLSTLIYAADSRALLGTIRRGSWIVKHGRHIGAETITARFHAAMKASIAG